MSVKYLETDATDEGSIRWYRIDDETYGLAHDGVILVGGGDPVLDVHEASAAIRVIAKYEEYR